MVSFFRKTKLLQVVHETTAAKRAEQQQLQEEQSSCPVDSVESGNTATTTKSSSSSNSSKKNNSNKKNSSASTSPPSTSIPGVRKSSSSWLGGGGGGGDSSRRSNKTAASPPSSPSLQAPPRPPSKEAETATAAATTATTKSFAKCNNNSSRARRRKKAPGVSGGSPSPVPGVSPLSRSSSGRSNNIVSKLPTVQEEGEGATTTTPSTSAAGAGAEGKGDVDGGGVLGTPETLDTTVTSTNDDDDDDVAWINSIALEPAVVNDNESSSFDAYNEGQVEILTLSTKQQRDDFLREESIKRRLFQQQLEQEMQQKELQQLQHLQQQQQQQQQQPQEHAVKSVPMMPYSYSSSPDADCTSKRSVSPLTISTGEKLLASYSAATSNKQLLGVARNTAATSLHTNAANKRSSSTPNHATTVDKENAEATRRASSNINYQHCPTIVTDAILQPFATRCIGEGGGGVGGACSPSSWTENITVTVESSSCTLAENDVNKAGGGDVQQDVLARHQEGLETAEDQSTIPTMTTTLDSVSQNNKIHTLMESSSSLASHSYAMRASSAIGTGAAAASTSNMGSSQQQQVSPHMAQFQAVAVKFTSAFNCSHAPQDILAQPLGVMAMFYDKLCLSAHDRQNLFGKEQDEQEDAQEHDWSNRKRPFFSEEFAVMFINRMVSEGISLLYLQSPGASGNEDSVEWKGKSVTMMIAPGSTGEAEMIQPKLEWTTVPGGLSVDMVTTCLPLLNIHSIITRAHNNDDTLGDELELDDDMCFFTITSRQGHVHVFEANTPDQRDAIVDGLQNAIARLAFHLVAGDSTASTELYNDDRRMQQQEDAGELPALPNPRLNMNRIAHMMLDY
jgi:hypothetical protein